MARKAHARILYAQGWSTCARRRRAPAARAFCADPAAAGIRAEFAKQIPRMRINGEAVGSLIASCSFSVRRVDRDDHAPWTRQYTDAKSMVSAMAASMT